MAITIDDLLNSLQNPDKATLDNVKATWERIGNKDVFSELGLDPTKLEEFLSEWIANNPYNNI
jgi:hypothetical protein